MNPLKILGLGLFVLFLHASILGIPFADMHTCELPNGDKVKIRTSQNWYLLKGLNPHGSAWGRETVKSWYVPKEWFKFRQRLQDAADCKNIRLLGELVTLNTERFVIENHKLLPIDSSGEDSLPGGYGGYWKLTPQEEKQLLIEVNDARRKEADFTAGYKAEFAFYERIDKQRRKQYGIDESLLFDSFMGKFGKTLWFELSFFEKNCNDNNVTCPIISVWQYHSADGGKTWSKPIITKDSKLFVIGKSIKEQLGVAKDKGILRYIGWF